MSSESKTQDWSKPAAMAIPKGGYLPGQGRTGALRAHLSQDPGLLWLLDRRESHSRPRRGVLRTCQDDREDDRRAAGRSCGAKIALPALVAVSHQRGNLFHVPRHFRHRLRQIHRGRCHAVLRSHLGITTVFESFLKDSRWTRKTNPASFVTFVREHQCPSFLEYGEYPFVSADEVKKALKLKAAFSTMLDQMQ